jgi:hypothetical protein
MKVNWGKIIIGSVGFIFLMYALLLISLSLFGFSTNAKITSYRQEYGERNETIRNQYTYLYGYEFEVDGKLFSGNGQRIGNSVYLKNNGTQTIQIKYLSCCPFVNHALDENKNTKQILITLLVSLGLFYFMFKID